MFLMFIYLQFEALNYKMFTLITYVAYIYIYIYILFKVTKYTIVYLFIGDYPALTEIHHCGTLLTIC